MAFRDIESRLREAFCLRLREVCQSTAKQSRKKTYPKISQLSWHSSQETGPLRDLKVC